MPKRFVAYLIFLGIYFYNYYSNSPQSRENAFLDISNLKLVDLDGHIVPMDKVNDKYILFLYFDSLRLRDKEILSYAEVLYRKYKHNGLKILGICSGNEAGCREFRSRAGFSFPFILDRENVLKHFLNVDYCCGATLLIEKNGVIKFRSPLLISQENLRQLLEKEIKGKIDYNLPPPLISVRDIKKRLFSLSFIDLETHEIKQIKNLVNFDFTIMNFYFNFCPGCKQARRNITLKTLKEATLNYKIKAEIFIIFPSFYTDKDIIEVTKYIDFPFPKLIYFGDFFSDNEKYVAEPSKKLDQLILVLDTNFNIVFMESPDQDELFIQNSILSLIKNIKK